MKHFFSFFSPLTIVTYCRKISRTEVLPPFPPISDLFLSNSMLHRCRSVNLTIVWTIDRPYLSSGYLFLSYLTAAVSDREWNCEGSHSRPVLQLSSSLPGSQLYSTRSRSGSSLYPLMLSTVFYHDWVRLLHLPNDALKCILLWVGQIPPSTQWCFELYSTRRRSDSSLYPMILLTVFYQE